MHILSTDRLHLRWFREDDAPTVLPMINERAWIENIRDPDVHTESEARRWIQERLVSACWRQGFGFWAIERRSDGALMGLCGLTHREGLPLPDLGYGLAQRYTGQGYAREAAEACLAYAQEVLGLDELLATTAPHNEASGRVLTAIGFAKEGLQQTAAHPAPSMVYRWRGPARSPQDDAAQIDEVVGRFFAAFDLRGGRSHTLAALPAWMLPDVQIRHLQGSSLSSLSLPEYLLPWAELLSQDRVQDFHLWETAHRTEIQGGLATRWLRCERRGRLDGAPWQGQSRKSLQLVKLATGWKIASLLWEEH